MKIPSRINLFHLRKENVNAESAKNAESLSFGLCGIENMKKYKSKPVNNFPNPWEQIGTLSYCGKCFLVYDYGMVPCIDCAKKYGVIDLFYVVVKK